MSNPILPGPLEGHPLTLNLVFSALFYKPSLPPAIKQPFAAMKSDDEIKQARVSGIPLKTQADTKYCIGLWEAWTAHRMAENGDAIQPIENLTDKELQHWMIRFMLEVIIKQIS